MKVFISWSGERSRAVAELLQVWIKCVLQSAHPWTSSSNIDRGALWFSEIFEQLKNTTVGIVVLTAENREKPWVLFEAGALAKGLESSRVCTFLVDLEHTDVKNPLAQFNHTQPNKAGMFALVTTLNKNLGEHALEPTILARVFDTYWPQFEKEFGDALRIPTESEAVIPRSEDDVLSEVLGLVRSLDRRMSAVEAPKVGPPEEPSVTASLNRPITIRALSLARRAVAEGKDEQEAIVYVAQHGIAQSQAREAVRRAMRPRQAAT